MEMNYLRDLLHSGTTVKVIVTNGFQLVGYIDDIGEKAIILESAGVRKLVFFHAISTIEPFTKKER